MEISAEVDRNDIERAMRRAKLLRQAGFRTIPVVAGEQLTDGAETQAEVDPVVVVLNGREQGWDRAIAEA
jgi:G:T-mismatch repair DNA endonuclease (very short patch repair protein)